MAGCNESFPAGWTVSGWQVPQAGGTKDWRLLHRLVYTQTAPALILILLVKSVTS